MCKQRARVERAKTSSVAQSATGGASRTWTVIHRQVPCRLMPLSAQLQVQAASAGIRATHQFFTPTNLGLRARDRVIVDGSTYAVHGWENAGGANKLYRAMVEAV